MHPRGHCRAYPLGFRISRCWVKALLGGDDGGFLLETKKARPEGVALLVVLPGLARIQLWFDGADGDAVGTETVGI